MSLWRTDLAAAIALVALVLAQGWVVRWHRNSMEEQEARKGLAGAGLTHPPPALDAMMLNPVCPDQWIAQRGAGERWQLKCITVSTEGSRATQ